MKTESGKYEMEKVVLKIELTIVKHRRDRNIGIYVWPTFSLVADTKQVVH